MTKINGIEDIEELAKKHNRRWVDSHGTFKEVVDLPPEIRSDMKKWIEALESGQYKQTRGRLYTKDTGYCCLGVALCVHGVDNDILDDVEVPGSLDPLYAKSNKFLKGLIVGKSEWYKPFMENELTYMNDDMKLSFEEIAAILRWKYDIHD